MKKIILAIVTVLSVNLMADCDIKSIKEAFANSKSGIDKILQRNENKGSLEAEAIGFARGGGEVMTARHGSLQNNIQNLQLPNGTIAVNKDWSNILFSLEKYINSAPTDKEVFLRTSKLLSIVFQDSDILHIYAGSALTTFDDPVLGTYQLINSINDKKKFQNALRRFIVFSTIADKGANDSFALEKVFANDIKHWECIFNALK